MYPQLQFILKVITDHVNLIGDDFLDMNDCSVCGKLVADRIC